MTLLSHSVSKTDFCKGHCGILLWKVLIWSFQLSFVTKKSLSGPKRGLLVLLALSSVNQDRGRILHAIRSSSCFLSSFSSWNNSIGGRTLTCSRTDWSTVFDQSTFKVGVRNWKVPGESCTAYRLSDNDITDWEQMFTHNLLYVPKLRTQSWNSFKFRFPERCNICPITCLSSKLVLH